MNNLKRLQFIYMDFIDVNIELRQRKTVINGNNGTGKSYLYNVIEQYAQEEKRNDILCLNVDNTDINDIDHTIERIQKIKDGIIIIDQADDILSNRKLYEYILSDKNNHYIIMSRKYFEKYSELARIQASNNSISIQYKLNVV